MARVFISHSGRDKDQAERLMAWLRAQGFENAFLDFDKHGGFAPGADWERTLYREIARSEAVLLVLTSNWLESKWCFAEFTQARALGKAIFPLVETPAGETFVAPDIQHLDLTKDRDGGLEKLSAELTRIALDVQGEFPWDRTRPPFPGLLAFDEADAAIYFGRDDDIRRLVERLNARRAQGGASLIALLGASGSGKSSLMRAGLIPRLKRDKRNWLTLPPFRPQLHPLDELAQAVAVGLGRPEQWRSWRQQFSQQGAPQTLSGLARDLRAAHGANEAHILISIDQGEELFATADPQEAEQFLALLSAALDERLPFMALMGLRSDYLGQLQQAEGLAAPFEEFSLKPMPLDRVRAIIEGPARVAGLEVEEGLITAAIKDAGVDDALPLLAFALRELFDRHGGDGRLSLAEYRLLGDHGAGLSPLENAVRRRADEVLAEAKPAEEELRALKEAFIPALVRVNAEGEYVRRPAGFDDLPVKARGLLERLAKARLLVIRQEGAARLVEVAHEALLRKWPLLRGWLDEEREFLIGKEQLEQDLRDWAKVGERQKAEALLSGLKLTRARAWLLARPHQLTEAERRFIEASARQADTDLARRERLRRRVQQLTAAALVLVTGFAGVSWYQWRETLAQRQLAEAHRLQAQASYERAKDSVGSLIFDIADGLRRLEGVQTETIVRALNTANATVDKLAAQNVDDPDLQRLRGAMFDQFAVTYLAAGEFEHALRSTTESIGIARRLLVADASNPLWQRQLAVFLSTFGDVKLAARDIASAQTAYDESLAIRRKLSAGETQSPELWVEIAASLNTIGDLRLRTDDVKGARTAYEGMLEICVELARREPSSTLRLQDLASTLDKIGDFELRNANYAKGYRALGEALVVARKLVALEPANPVWQSYLAERLRKSGKYSGNPPSSLKSYEEMLALLRSIAEVDPREPRLQREIAAALEEIGDLQLRSVNWDAARAAYEEMLGVVRKTAALRPEDVSLQRDVALALGRLSAAHSSSGNTADALDLAAEALSLFRTLSDRDPTNSNMKRDVALAYMTLGDLKPVQDKEGAREAYNQGMRIGRSLAAEDPSNPDAQTDLVIGLSKLADLQDEIGERDAADASVQEATTIVENLTASRLLNSDPRHWPSGLAAALQTLDSLRRARAPK